MPRAVWILSSLLALFASGCVGLAGRAAGEAAEEATAPIVDESLEAFADPENRARIAEILSSPEMRRATANLTAGAMDGVLHSLSSPESVEAFTPEMGRLARVIAQQVTLGIDEALAEVSTRPAPTTGIGRILVGAEEATVTSTWMMPLAIGALALCLAVAVALVVRSNRRARRAREEAEARDRALSLLAGALEEAERRPWGAELHALLRARARDDASGLDRILGRHGDGGGRPH